MDLFYIRHHYKSIVRSTSFDGEIFAFIVLTILFGSMISYSYILLDDYASSVSDFFGQKEVNFLLFLGIYLFLDLGIRLIIRRPLPKLKYYMLWLDRPKQIASQYLVTSLFGITPFIFGISMIMVMIKATEWLGAKYLLAMMLWWVANHFIALATQFAAKWVRSALAGTILLVLLLQFLLPQAAIVSTLLHPLIPVTVLPLSVMLSYFLVKRVIERREIHERQQSASLFESLPVISFKNPIFQLEWALLVRNKRTRSNILLGLISILILPFVLDESSVSPLSILIYFISTGFFIIQHGVYSLGWEGSYFDFLLTNISPKDFIRTRYAFYLGTCLVGLLLASIPTLINGLNWMDLLMIFLYNIGVTIPLVLYRSTFNGTKIILTENSFMNYNGMMTGPIFVTSFLVTLLPMIIFGIGQAILGDQAILILGAMGIGGLVLFQPITEIIARKYMKKKYHLSQSFKA